MQGWKMQDRKMQDRKVAGLELGSDGVGVVDPINTVLTNPGRTKRNEHGSQA